MGKIYDVQTAAGEKPENIDTAFMRADGGAVSVPPEQLALSIDATIEGEKKNEN